MADTLDDGEFWLPPQFLTDDDIIADNKNTTLLTDHPTSTFPYGFPPLAAPSNPSSPVESVVGSSETESDEDEYLAGLTRHMAHSSLLDSFPSENPKWIVSGSPQSTLCSVGTGSPNSDIQVYSPPATWDLLHAAAEVARMRMSKDSFAVNKHGMGLLGPPRKPSPDSVSVKNSNPDIGFYHYFQTPQFQQMREQNMVMKQTQGVFGRRENETGRYEQYRGHEILQSRGSNQFLSGGDCGHVGFPPSLRPSSLQHSQNHQQNGSAVRAVFIGNHSSSSKRECAGTGVFLPRQQLAGGGTPSETRKKTACSTVLVPARVMQALNLNMEDMGVHQPHVQPGFSPRFDQDHYASLRLRSNNNIQTHQQKRNLRIQPAAVNHQLIRLPQEWTY